MKIEEYADIIECYREKCPNLTRDQIIKLLLIQSVDELNNSLWGAIANK